MEPPVPQWPLSRLCARGSEGMPALSVPSRRLSARLKFGSKLSNFLALTALAVIAFATQALAGGGGGGLSVSDNNTHIDRGVIYTNSAFLTASGGTAPYTFTVNSGLPAG